MTMNLGSRFDETTQRMFVDLRDQNNGDAVGVISNAIKRYWSDCFVVKPTSRVTAPVGVRNTRDEMLKAIRHNRVKVHRDFIESVYNWALEHNISLSRLSLMVGFKDVSAISLIASQLRNGGTRYTNPEIVKRLEAITGLQNCSNCKVYKTKKALNVAVTPAYAKAVKRHIYAEGYAVTAVSKRLFGKRRILEGLLYRIINDGQRLASEYIVDTVRAYSGISPSEYR